MKILKLDRTKGSDMKIGKRVPFMKPTVTESCLLELDGKVIGFYLTELPEKMALYANIANQEFLSPRVPKSLLERSEVLANQRKLGITRAEAKAMSTIQMSTILGGIIAKPHMRRPYNSTSQVHTNKKAKNFVKAMLLMAREAESLIKKYMPEQYENQLRLIQESTLPQYRFGELFTSSICNYNISAPIHIDRGNLKDTVNVIVTKRKSTEGGALFVPEFGEVFEQSDGSVLVYPAWFNKHGVTEIKQNHPKGYRNSLILYPLKGFDK